MAVVTEGTEAEVVGFTKDNEAEEKLSKEARLVAEEDEVVGFTKYCERLVHRLLNRESEKLEVIVIQGEGGSGKSTLATKVYNDGSIKDNFTSRGRMLVSKTYSLSKLFLSILNDITVINEEIYQMQEWELKREVVRHLYGHRYLILIDDVWSTKPWEELKDAFPDNNKGSRILLTTRLWAVAYPISKADTCWPLSYLHYNDLPCSSSQKYSCFQIQSLNMLKSWELFCKKISGEKKFDEELEQFGRSVVEFCHGRPLIIVLVACILRDSEMTVSRWSDMVDRIKGFRNSNEQSDILNLCYDEIPQELKTCFRYLGVFPEDFEISVKQLIQLWMAEGLIQSKEDNNMDGVAEKYLEELTRRNLIQVTRRRSDGGAKSCRIHDFIRDLCIRLSKEDHFLEVHTGIENSIWSKPKGQRAPGQHAKRLSILNNPQDDTSNLITCNSSSDLCSFSCFSEHTQSISEENWKALFRCSPTLRVLNLGEEEVGKLPETTGELYDLSYLRVKPVKNIRVPAKSIFNLSFLQTIDLRNASLPKLPKELWKMQQLKHLYLDGTSRLPNAETEDCLPNLLTLSYISKSSMTGISISEKAPNLRKLGLYKYHCVSKREQEFTFNLQHLQSLKFSQECIFEESITLSAAITKITVKEVVLQLEIIKMFGDLPNLEILKVLQTNFQNDEFKVSEKNSFPKLQLLKFENSTIVTWKLEKGAMAKLQRLVLSSCSQLAELPTALWDGNTLQEIELVWPSTKLANQLVKDLKNKGLKLMIYPPPSNTRNA